MAYNIIYIYISQSVNGFIEICSLLTIPQYRRLLEGELLSYFFGSIKLNKDFHFYHILCSCKMYSPGGHISYDECSEIEVNTAALEHHEHFLSNLFIGICQSV